MKILAIETSCDETSAAVIEGDKSGVKILSNVVSSQIKIHRKYGGVVPEVAARNHVKNIIPVVDKALYEAFSPGFRDQASLKSERASGPFPHIKKAVKEMGLIAVTSGPGLISSLLIGMETADTLSLAWNKPIIPVNHIEGHIYANWLKPISAISNFQFPISKVVFPALALVVSGGHTQLVLMRDHHKYRNIGQTRDDAVGEAFDKVAKILDIGYPGGPIISRLAQKGSVRYNLPRPMMGNNDLDFSFSGLKTAVLYLVRDLKVGKGETPPLTPAQRGGEIHPSASARPSRDGLAPSQGGEAKHGYGGNLPPQIIADVCASFQHAVVDVLVHKTIRAAKMSKVKSILLAGGVAANKKLREEMEKRIQDELSLPFFVPDLNFCTDNAAMIGAAAYYRVQKNPGLLKKENKIKVDPNWEL